MPDSQPLSDRWSMEVCARSGQLMHECGHNECEYGCRETKSVDMVSADSYDRLRAELEALKANESAGVMCDACGISLNTARAGNAIEAAGEHGGHVMCGACRDAAKFQVENERLREDLEGIKATADRACQLQCGYEVFSDIATLADLALASTTKEPT